MKKFKKPQSKILGNESGFMTAEFLFAFTMVIGCGIVIFAMTFALMTIEIAQYIVWSSARSFAAANGTRAESVAAGQLKYQNLTASFPLLTGNGADSPWFKMSDTPIVDDLAIAMGSRDGELDADNRAGNTEVRHPWTGVQADLDLILFKGLQIPFLGKVADEANRDIFKFPVRGILLRHPSQDECLDFYKRRFDEGIKKISAETSWDTLGDSSAYVPMEDNGC